MTGSGPDVRIGELADLAGVVRKTVRCHEDSELLPVPARTAAGRRSYGEHDLDPLQFVRAGQRLRRIERQASTT